MGADGNLISKGQGDGEAIMFQPFLPDQTPFIQMNQALARRPEQEAQQRKSEQDDAAAKKEAWMKNLNGKYKYHPKDEKAIFEKHKELIAKIENWKNGTPTSEIDNDFMALNYATNSSLDALNYDNKIQSDLLANSDKVWYKGVDEWKKAQVDNDGATYEDMIKNIAKRKAAQEGVVQGGEKINNPYEYIDKIIAKAPAGAPQVVPRKGQYGQTINEIITFTDKNKLDETLKFTWDNNPEAQRVFQTFDDFKEQAHNRAKFDTRVNIKGAQASSSSQEVQSNNGGGSVSVGNFQINKPIKVKVTLNEPELKKAWITYSNSIDDAANKTMVNGVLSAAGQKIMDEKQTKDDFMQKGVAEIDVIPISNIGQIAENSKYEFLTTSGKKVEGKTTGYNPANDTFVVTDEKGVVHQAKVSDNEHFLAKNKIQSSAKFYEAVAALKNNGSVQIDKSGVVSQSGKSNKKSLPPIENGFEYVQMGGKIYKKNTKTKKGFLVGNTADYNY